MSDQADDLLSGMLPDFLDESRMLLEQLNENLLTLDAWAKSDAAHGDAELLELLNVTFRAAHSMKGLSAMLGLTDINVLTHRLESLLDAGRRGHLAMEPHVIEVIFHGVDQLEGMVQRVAVPTTDCVDCTSTLEAIAALLHEAAEGPFPAAPAASTAPQTHAPAPSSSTSPGAFPASSADSAERSTSQPPQPNSMATSAAEHQFATLADETDIPAKYLAIFIDETESSLDSFCETLLTLDPSSPNAATEQLMITAHRIKGSAASIGLHRAAKLTHVLEDILQVLRDQRLPLTPDMVDVMLRCGDELRAFVERLRQGNLAAQDEFALRYAELQTLQQRLRSPSGGETKDTAAAQGTSCASDREPSRPSLSGLSARQLADLRLHAPPETSGFVGQLCFAPGLPLVGLKAQLATEKLLRLGTLWHCHPAPDELEACEELDVLLFVVATAELADVVESHRCLAGVNRVVLHAFAAATAETLPPLAPAPEPAATPASAAGASPRAASPSPVPPANEPPDETKGAKVEPGNRPVETLRVDIERLDQLMNLAGQLVINKARFVQIGEGLKHLLSNRQTVRRLSGIANLLKRIAEAGEQPVDARAELAALGLQAKRAHAELQAALGDVRQLCDARTSVSHLFEATHQLGRVADGIQKSVMDTRMVPIGPLFTRFKRVIRDVTRGNGKDVQLVIRGEKTELDKRMIDELGDPLIHMVRNSADHGIEAPAERERAGKPRQGTVTLDAFHRGNSIVIQVSDDGRGLDVDRIRRKAIEKGLVSASDAERLTPHQVYQLIWEPGFSTAEQVTEISGRGMGMDIVRSKIEQLSGTVDIQSEPGQGTTLSLKLPLTLAILPSLLAEIDHEVFAIPIEAVREIVSVPPNDLTSVLGVATATLRGRVVSVVHFTEIFDRPLQRAVGAEPAPVTLVVVHNEGQEIGLVVDRLLGEEDIVIKSLADNYRNIQGISGASILGDGRVSLILDTSALITLAAQKFATFRGEPDLVRRLTPSPCEAPQAR